MCTTFCIRTERDKILATLPDEFFVYKVVGQDGRPQFYTAPNGRDSLGEPSLLLKGIYEAGDYPSKRSPMEEGHRPGYHVFLSREDAQKYILNTVMMLKNARDGKSSSLKTRKYRARKEWVTGVGKTWLGGRDGLTLILSKIEVIKNWPDKKAAKSS